MTRRTRFRIIAGTAPVRSRSSDSIATRPAGGKEQPRSQPPTQAPIREIAGRTAAEKRSRRDHEGLRSLIDALLWPRQRCMRSLNDMSVLLRSCGTQQEVAKVIAAKARRVFGGSGCLAIVRAPQGILDPVAHWGPERPVVAGSWKDCRALRCGCLHHVPDPTLAVLCRHFDRPPRGGYFCVPLIEQEVALGVLCVINPRGQDELLASERLLLAVNAGETIALVLSNLTLRERLREQADRDDLGDRDG